MTVRVPVEGALLAWAQRRSRVSRDRLLAKFPALDAWEVGEKQPTLRQLEQFARATYTPVGYLFLSEPPQERLPVPDFRTIGEVEVGQASPDLLDTIYQCQQRQNWYRDYARSHRESPVAFVGALTVDVDIGEAATQMRAVLAFEPAERGASWSEAVRRLIEEADQHGVLAMVNGVVGSNTHRKLDPREFRGFALSDDHAPLIFVNGADTKAAQIFTLAHELAHLWLGESAVSDVDLAITSTNTVERWCNRVAAEFLLPLADLGDVDVDEAHLTDELERLARKFKVSTLVALRRVFDAGLLSEARYRIAYAAERDRILELMEEGTSAGGNFYNTQPIRVSKRFARALIESTLEGQTLHRDAFQMLGFKKHGTFDELARRLGVVS
ncbi:MAG TPA: ImmA/IrrE family metallo-endopeptidase [Solirubrobacteraceae bacterium]|nr:ImmA/IrrE family metallo-endopeptidase [Solirubrobacteraceae bacterium]